MNQGQTNPSVEKVKETVATSRKHRQELALASLELEEIVAQLEQENRSKRKEYFQKALSSLNF